MTYTRNDIYNELSRLQATMYPGLEWQEDIREIMKKILLELRKSEKKNERLRETR